MQTIVGLQFATQTSLFPYVRNACVAANLIAPKSKVVDGVSRLLTKSDLQTLTRKDRLLHVTSAETLLSETWEQLAGLVSTGAISKRDTIIFFGKMSSRVALLLCKKAKDGIEQTVYLDFREIKNAYIQELAAVTGSAQAPQAQQAAASHVAYHG